MHSNKRPSSVRAPRVSLGMPVFNGERWLDATLEALRSQSFADFELIISDNASEDRSQEICELHAADDARVRYVRQARNIGANRNYVAVLAHASAPYFKWTSANDLCASEFLDSCVRALDRRPDAVLAFPQTSLFVDDIADATEYECDFAVEDEQPSLRFARIIRETRLNNSFNGLIRTEALRRSLTLGSFDAADIVLMAELALLGKSVLVPQRLFFRRMSRESATLLRGRRALEAHIEPGARRPLLWQHWKYHLRVLRAAARSSPRGAEWLRAVGFSLRYMAWARNELAHDVLEAARQMTPAGEAL